MSTNCKGKFSTMFSLDSSKAKVAIIQKLVNWFVEQTLIEKTYISVVLNLC